MARFPRAVGVGLTHHITQRCINRERIFFTDADRQTYLNWLAEYAAPDPPPHPRLLLDGQPHPPRRRAREHQQ